jgi:hypothetical protein
VYLAAFAVLLQDARFGTASDEVIGNGSKAAAGVGKFGTKYSKRSAWFGFAFMLRGTEVLSHLDE